jgi:hypothetical protein
MDVLMDTNAVRQAGIGGAAFKALGTYMEITRSDLLIPSAVVEELCAQRERDVQELVQDLDKSFKSVRRMFPDTEHEMPVLDAAQSSVALRKQLSELVERVKFVENGPGDMTELVRRLARRIPPASKAGEEARDVLIWLALLPRARSGRLAFVSNDKGFFANEKLKPELIADLGEQTGNVEVFRSLDDFLKRHASRSTFITSQWIEEQLKDSVQVPLLLRAFQEKYNEDESNPLGIDISDWGEETYYSDPTTISDPHVLDFFVSDAEANGLYVSATLIAEVEIEFEFYPWTGSAHFPVDVDNPRCYYRYPEVVMQLQLEVVDDCVESIRVSSMEIDRYKPK